MTMDATVLICTWKNQQRLEIALQSMENCLLPVDFKWELIVVNNDCENLTSKVIRKFESRLPLREVIEERAGKSRALNKGLRHSRGKLIVFTDDDVRVCRDWIAVYWNAFKSMPEDHFFGGPVESEFELENPDENLVRLAPFSVKGLNLGDKPRIIDEDEMFVGANWACSKDVIARFGGFDEDKGLNAYGTGVFVGEEKFLMDKLRKNGMTPYFLPTAGIKHFVPARKCTLNHVASRFEASAFNNARELMESYKGIIIAGVPLWMYRKYFVAYAQWFRTKLVRQNDYVEFINTRRAVGRIRGALSVRKA